MSVKKEASGRRSVQVEVEVPGTPEQVWQAIATGPGVSSWFVPTESEERVGGAVIAHFGPGMDSTATVTAWDPPRRFAAESPDLGPNAPTLATEWVVEARSGGTCVVRVVHSLFASTDDWDDQLESIESGWPAFFRILRLYLTQFRGERCSTFQLMGVAPEPVSKAWGALTASLGLGGATLGQRRKTAARWGRRSDPGRHATLQTRPAGRAGARRRLPERVRHGWPGLYADQFLPVRRPGRRRRRARRACMARVGKRPLSFAKCRG